MAAGHGRAQFLWNCFVSSFIGAGPNRNPARTRPASMAAGNFSEIEHTEDNFFEIAHDENCRPTRPLTLYVIPLQGTRADFYS